MRLKAKLILGIVVAGLLVAPCRTYAGEAPESKEHRDARMGWWREARFGMFIHWGLYCVPAGTYNGKQIHSLGEWIMRSAHIPVAVYADYAKQFNPVKFNADQWVSIAKNAGMKYMVITAKHHEGFAMFHTKVDGYNIYDATPFKRDPLAELAVACKKAGIKLGFYYSQSQDWHHPGGGPSDSHWDKAQSGSFDEFEDHVDIPHLKELLTNYGDFPAVLWFDTPRDITAPRAQRIYDVVHQLRPNIIMNNRLGGGFKGDYGTPEQKIPAALSDKDFETCMTLNKTWGYKSYDTNWKPASDVLFKLVDIASKGGNYLLNVGPTSEGLIPDPCPAILATVGNWLKVNGESIYGTRGSPWGAEVKKNEWRCTTKPGKMYIHLLVWPGGRFTLHSMKNRVAKAYMLVAPTQKLQFSQSGDSAEISLPSSAPDKLDSVLVLEIN